VPRILLLVVVALLLEIASPFGPSRTDAGPQPQPSQLSGTVLNHFGKPAQFASVLALNDDSCPSGCGLSSTDANGHWEATIEPGTYIFQAGGLTIDSRYDGNAFWTSHGSTTDESEAEEVVITSDQNITLDFMLPGSGGLTWQITDGSGEPIAYPDIVIEGTCACNLVPLTGGQSGTYSHELATGHYTVSAASPGYVTMYWTASGGTPDPALAEGVRICPSRQTVIGIRLHASAPAGGATPIPVPPPTLGCPAPYDYQSGTFLKAAATAGSSLMSVDDASALEAGDMVLISGGTAPAEIAEVETKNFGTPSAQPQGHSLPGYITFGSPLLYSHSVNDRVAEVFNGDINCDGSRSLLDATTFLRRMAGSSRTVPPGCPELDNANNVGKLFGDLDCDGDAQIGDVLYFLAWWVALPAEVPLLCIDQ